MTSIEFTLTPEEFLQAMRLHHTLSLKGRRFALGLGWIAFVLAVVAVVLALTTRSGPVRGMEYGLLMIGASFAALAVQIAINRVVFIPRASHRQFNQLRALKAPTKYEVQPLVIAVTTLNGFANIPTEDLVKWAEDRHVLMLYRTDRSFNVIPRRAMDGGFHDALIAELARAGVPKASFRNS
jgi:hypothetical protein